MTISPIDIELAHLQLATKRAADSMASGPTGLKIVSETKQISQPRTRILAIIRRDRLAEI
jgi:hypothetical protein